MPSWVLPPAARASACRAPQLVVAGGGQGLVEHGLVVAAVVPAAGGGLERERIGGDEVLAADLDRVHADLVGEQVDHALDGRGGLGPAGAAVGADVGGVGDDRPDADRDVVDRRSSPAP